MTDYPEMKGIFWTCIIALVVLLCLPHKAHASDLSITSTAILADSLTTFVALRQDGTEERNPILGKHPSAGKQALFAAAKLAGNYYVITHTEGKTRKYWTVAVSVVGFAAAGNNLFIIQRNW